MATVNILTPSDLAVLEMVTGQREPQQVHGDTLVRLVSQGFLQPDVNGAVHPTDRGVRASSPQTMKDITP